MAPNDSINGSTGFDATPQVTYTAANGQWAQDDASAQKPLGNGKAAGPDTWPRPDKTTQDTKEAVSTPAPDTWPRPDKAIQDTKEAVSTPAPDTWPRPDKHTLQSEETVIATEHAAGPDTWPRPDKTGQDLKQTATPAPDTWPRPDYHNVETKDVDTKDAASPDTWPRPDHQITTEITEERHTKITKVDDAQEPDTWPRPDHHGSQADSIKLNNTQEPETWPRPDHHNGVANKTQLSDTPEPDTWPRPDRHGVEKQTKDAADPDTWPRPDHHNELASKSQLSDAPEPDTWPRPDHKVHIEQTKHTADPDTWPRPDHHDSKANGLPANKAVKTDDAASNTVPSSTARHPLSAESTAVQEPQPTQQTNKTDALPNYEQARYAPQGQPPAGGAHMANDLPLTVVPLNALSGEASQPIDCPFCHQRTKTIVTREGGSMQFVVGAVLCLVCVCLACLPCIAGWFENVEYRCSRCRGLVAARKNDGPLEVFGPTTTVYSQYGNQPPMATGRPEAKQVAQLPHEGQQSQQPDHPELSG